EAACLRRCASAAAVGTAPSSRSWAPVVFLRRAGSAPATLATTVPAPRTPSPFGPGPSPFGPGIRKRGSRRGPRSPGRNRDRARTRPIPRPLPRMRRRRPLARNPRPNRRRHRIPHRLHLVRQPRLVPRSTDRPPVGTRIRRARRVICDRGARGPRCCCTGRPVNHGSDGGTRLMANETPFEGGGFIVPVRGTTEEKIAAERYVRRQATRLGASDEQLEQVLSMLGVVDAAEAAA